MATVYQRDENTWVYVSDLLDQNGVALEIAVPTTLLNNFEQPELGIAELQSIKLWADGAMSVATQSSPTLSNVAPCGTEATTDGSTARSGDDHLGDLGSGLSY